MIVCGTVQCTINKNFQKIYITGQFKYRLSCFKSCLKTCLKSCLKSVREIVTPVTLKSDVGVIQQRPETGDFPLESDNAQSSKLFLFFSYLYRQAKPLFQMYVQQEYFRGVKSHTRLWNGNSTSLVRALTFGNVTKIRFLKYFLSELIRVDCSVMLSLVN